MRRQRLARKINVYADRCVASINYKLQLTHHIVLLMLLSGQLNPLPYISYLRIRSYFAAKRRDAAYCVHIDRATRSINLATIDVVASLSVGSTKGPLRRSSFSILELSQLRFKPGAENALQCDARLPGRRRPPTAHFPSADTSAGVYHRLYC